MIVICSALCGCDERPAYHVEVTDRDMTSTAIVETSYRIGMYFKANDRLPADLSVLPARQGYINRTNDGWNRPLIYQSEKDSFSLISLGKDGVAGGTGDNADMIHKYRVSNGQLGEVP